MANGATGYAICSPTRRARKAELVQLAKTADFEKLPTPSLMLLGDGLWDADAQEF